MKNRPRFTRAVTLLTLLAVLTSLFLVVNVAPVSAQAATIAPAAGPIGTVITVTDAGGWTASEVITPVTVGGVAATHTLVVSGGAVISGTITVPAGTPLGAQAIVITGATSGAVTITPTFTVTTATFTPVTGTIGVATTVTGTLWATAADTTITVTVGAVAAADTLAVSAAGVLSGTITPAATTPVGAQAVVITAAISGVQTFAAAFTLGNATGVVPNPATAGDAATYTINVIPGGTTAYTALGGDTITLTFPSGIVLPATISKSYVSIAGVGFAVGDPEPVVNTVTRQVILTTATVAGTQATAINAARTGGTAMAIVIAQAAGITNPGIAKIALAASPYRVAVASSIEGAMGSVAYEVIPTLAISPTSAVRLQPVTVTGEGWTPGQSIKVPTLGVLSGNGTIAADGTFSFIAWPLSSGALTVIDGAGQTQAAPWVAAVTIPTFTLLPKIGVSPATVNVGAAVTLSGFDFTSGGGVTANSITLGGTALTHAAITLATVDSNLTFDDIPAATTLTIPTNTVAAFGGIPPGAKTISVTDGTVTATTTLTVNTPTITISPASGPPGTQVTITGSNFSTGTPADTFTANSITIGGTAITHAAITVDASGNWVTSSLVPTAAASGMNNVVATSVGVTLAGAGFTVANRVLTLSPDSGPVGTRVSIGGSNMSTPTVGGGPLPGGLHQVNLNLVTFAGAAWNTAAAIAIDSLGNINPTTLVVPAAGTGAQTVSATDTGAAVAAGTFTVTQPTISLDKATGYRGDTITLAGSGWVPGSLGLVTISFAAATILTATPDANGDITALFVVPATAAGASLVAATDISGNNAASQTLTLLPPTLTVDPTSGPVTTTVSIVGVGFQPQTGVTALTIGGASVMPATPIVTDTIGGFTATFTVPGLAQVAQTVSVTVAGVTATTAFTISVAPPSVAGATASISTQLVRVWGYAAGAWEMYDPADVPGSDLASLTPGRGYWVSVSADVRLLFAANSYDLTTGWNLIGWR